MPAIQEQLSRADTGTVHDVADEQTNSSPQSPSPRQRLADFGGTTLYLADGSHPWTLPLDAMVVPMNSAGAFGRVGLAVNQFDRKIMSGFEVPFQNRRTEGRPAVEPTEPVAIEVEPRQGFQPRFLIGATAWLPDGDKATLDGASRAARAVIELAVRLGARRLGLTLLGTGASKPGLAPSQVMRAILAVVNASLPKRGLAEITIFATEADARQEAISLFNSIPQRFSNDAAAGEDLLDVGSEVQALTDILLLRNMQPPLAVGILGGWGSGKSFAMHLMRQHIQRIRCQRIDPDAAWSDGKASPYVGHIYSINFDAWTYAKSNLWASLMQVIFLELSRQLGREKLIREQLARSNGHLSHLEGRLWFASQGVNEADRKVLLQQPGLADIFDNLSKSSESTEKNMLWTAMAALKKEKQESLKEKEKKKAEVVAQAEAEKAEITRDVDAEIRAKAGHLAWQHASPKLKKALQEFLQRSPEGVAAIDDGKKVLEVIDHAQKDAASFRMYFWDYFKVLWQNPVLAIAGVCALLLPVALGIVLFAFQQQIAAVVAWLGSAFGALAGIARVARSWTEKVKSTAQSLAQEVRNIEGVLETARNSRVQEVLASNKGANVRKLEHESKQLTSDIERLRQQIGVTADYVSLADLVSARAKTTDYEDQLGLMHRVQRDLNELTNALTLADGHPSVPQFKIDFPRGPARIVLFIDDLDRCPPDRVVEVLEATQLLVKTSLFVVVLALDVRYVTRALEKVYKDILTRRGSPCGLDYIEKIVQLPYSIRPVDRTNLDRFLTSQMDVARQKQEQNQAATAQLQDDRGEQHESSSESSGAAKPITSEVVQFTADELQWITNCCVQVPLTPRAIKRIVNAFKLLKIVWYRPNRHNRPSAEVQQAFLALLCLSARYPNAMRQLFDRVAEAFDEGKEVPLLARMQEAAGAMSGQSPDGEQARVQRDLQLIPTNAKLLPSLRPTFELVRSLSFVAEIGYNPQEDGPANPKPKKVLRRRTAAAGNDGRR